MQKKMRNQILEFSQICNRKRKLEVTDSQPEAEERIYRLFFIFLVSKDKKNKKEKHNKQNLSDDRGWEEMQGILPPEVLGELEIVARHSYFRGKKGESIHLPRSRSIILGIGKKKNWSLEGFSEAIIAADSVFKDIYDCSLSIVLGDHLFAAKERLPRGEIEPMSLENATDASQVKSKMSERKINPADLVAHTIVALELVFDNMSFLKNKKNANLPEDTAEKPIMKIRIVLPQDKSDDLAFWLKRANDLSHCIWLSRSIASTPGNILTPQTYQDYAEKLAIDYDLDIEVISGEKLAELGFNGVINVGKGSVIPPRVIILQYHPTQQLKTKKPLVLVGKGITFDTGGISLKPSQKMHEMKYDMCGSSLVVHTIALAAKRAIPLPIYAIIGLAENMPDGKAMKPGDVYQAYNGLTVENQNTDAEGRLILADLLAYASEKNPHPLCMLDFATLTGACVVALGHEAAGLMTGSDDLARRLLASSERSSDRLWRLPHWRIYDKGLKSSISDICNISNKGAGTITAMRFLAHFVPSQIKHWAHLDIAGVAWHEDKIGSQTSGATGWGLRLMLDFMEQL